MAQTAADGSGYRATLELSAARGNAEARRALQEPECPEPVQYLVEWAYQLVGRSGEGMNGVAPLSYACVDAWSRLTGIEPTPDEVAALLVLDHAIRHPEPTPVVVRDVVPAPAWPEKSNGC